MSGTTASVIPKNAKFRFFFGTGDIDRMSLVAGNGDRQSADATCLQYGTQADADEHVSTVER